MAKKILAWALLVAVLMVTGRLRLWFPKRITHPKGNALGQAWMSESGKHKVLVSQGPVRQMSKVLIHELYHVLQHESGKTCPLAFDMPLEIMYEARAYAVECGCPAEDIESEYWAEATALHLTSL